MILCLIKIPQPLFELDSRFRGNDEQLRVSGMTTKKGNSYGIELKRGNANNKAFSLVELMMAVAFSVLLMIGVYGFYSVSSQSYSSGVSGQTLQDGANIVLSKIIEGGTEPGGTVYRLATSASYYIPNGNPNVLYYCQDNPCSPADPTARWYTLDSTYTKVLYYHHTSNSLGYDVIYSAPAGSSFFNSATNSKTLRFLPAAVGTPLNVVEIDVALTQNLSAGITNKRLAVSGAASTFVLLRNHP